MAITQEQIFQVADTLVEQGRDPTLASVRTALGGGSFTTISETMKAWRARKDAARQAHILPPPAALQEYMNRTGADLVAQAWQQAQAAAEARLESERAALAEARVELEVEARQAAELADQMELELERVMAERTAAINRAEQRLAERDQAQRERDEARRQGELLQARLTDLVHDRDAARQEAKEALTKAATLEGLLQSERDRRQQAEQVQATRLAVLLERLEASVVTSSR